MDFEGHTFVMDYSLLTGATNYTFTPDVTWFVSGNVYLYGTTRFLGGAVIKYTNFITTPSLRLRGPVECDTDPLRPVIFTSQNDDTVGWAEIAGCKRDLEGVLGAEVRHFCYPYGGSTSIGAVAPVQVERYYRSATTMARGRLGHHGLALLPRVPVYPHDDAALVRLKVLTA